MHVTAAHHGVVELCRCAGHVLTFLWGSQWMAETALPLLCCKSVKDWYSEMVFSLRLPVPLSSSPRNAKSSSKMLVTSFCCKASSHLGGKYRTSAVLHGLMPDT